MADGGRQTTSFVVGCHRLIAWLSSGRLQSFASKFEPEEPTAELQYKSARTARAQQIARQRIGSESLCAQLTRPFRLKAADRKMHILYLDFWSLLLLLPLLLLPILPPLFLSAVAVDSSAQFILASSRSRSIRSCGLASSQQTVDFK